MQAIRISAAKAGVGVFVAMLLVACGGGIGGFIPLGTQMGGARQGVVPPLVNSVSTFAGSASLPPGAADGSGTAASFHLPADIATDGINLYVADSANNAIRMIAISSGAVTTLAGSAASFSTPVGITTDGVNVYVADTNNNKIRQIVIATGVVSTLAGSGLSGSADSTTGTSASFTLPQGITTDGKNVYVADTNNSTIRQIVISSGVVTTLAGTALTTGSTDTTTSTSALFNLPQGITTDGTNLYVADTGNSTIRKVVISSAAVTTLAGTAGTPGSSDGIGTAAQFNQPTGLTTDGLGLYIADSQNNTIRRIQ